jgi:hypothetical protein
LGGKAKILAQRLIQVVRVDAIANLKHAQVGIRDEKLPGLVELIANRCCPSFGNGNENALQRRMKSFVEQKWFINSHRRASGFFGCK